MSYSPYSQAVAGYQQALAAAPAVGCGCSGGWSRSGFGSDAAAVPVATETGPFGLSSTQALGVLALGALTLGAFVYLGRD